MLQGASIYRSSKFPKKIIYLLINFKKAGNPLGFTKE